MAWLPAWLLSPQRESGSAVGSSAVVLERSAEAPAEHATNPAGRRDRALEAGDRVLLDGLAEKVLHGWLQNRHQTLYPLTVNLRQLDPAQGAALARWLAVSMLSNRPPTDGADRRAATRAWFASVGADAALLATLDDALAAPPALSDALASIADLGLSAYAYVLALVALDPMEPASLPFLDYVAARLALPTTVVRSATRRYRQ